MFSSLVMVHNSFTRGTMKDGFSGQFFRIFEISKFCFVIAIFELTHDVKAYMTCVNC